MTKKELDAEIRAVLPGNMKGLSRESFLYKAIGKLVIKAAKAYERGKKDWDKKLVRDGAVSSMASVARAVAVQMFMDKCQASPDAGDAALPGYKVRTVISDLLGKLADMAQRRQIMQDWMTEEQAGRLAAEKERDALRGGCGPAALEQLREQHRKELSDRKQECAALKGWLRKLVPNAVLEFGKIDYGVEWVDGKAEGIGASIRRERVALKYKLGDAQLEVVSLRMELDKAKEKVEELTRKGESLCTNFGSDRMDLLAERKKVDELCKTLKEIGEKPAGYSRDGTPYWSDHSRLAKAALKAVNRKKS